MQGKAKELFLVVLGVFFLSYLIRRRQARLRANPHRLPLPPGPKPLPIVGNLQDIPRDSEAARYNKLAREHGESPATLVFFRSDTNAGDLVFLSVFGKTILVVNTYQVANDLFEKRSSNYSDRNELPMINDLMGWDWSFGHMPYGDRWKAHRKIFHTHFQSSVVSVYWPIQLKEAHKLLRRLLHEPEELLEHLRHNSASTIMNVTYGIEVSDEDDRYISVAEKALDGMAKAAHPGAFLVDIFPILKHVPEFIPFAGFKKKAREWRKAVMEMRDAPYETVKNALKQGTAAPCFVSYLLDDLEMKKENRQQEDTIRNCAGLALAGTLPHSNGLLPILITLLAAGAESTVSSLSSFMLAMVLYPDVQSKARHEIDTVIGQGRLPDFSDRGSLPYIDAVVREVLRWNPVAPLGLPHMVTHDDEYNGYFIPAGTTIVGNSWTILHDPVTYPDPGRFNPERFLGVGKGSPVFDHVSVAFGYGRRVCPGRFMAEGQLWVSVACILSAFDISPGYDKNGKPVQIQAAFASGMISHPLPFRCTITPRSELSRKLVEQTADLAP
ncbi:cytochrome P450 [Desarmillaria ectypa]|nr:cytochrome P450 [Desarmillaria ectypa]